MMEPMTQVTITITEYIIANATSPPVCFEPAVIVYHRRFQMDPAVMLTYHRQFVIRPGGDALERRQLEEARMLVCCY